MLTRVKLMPSVNRPLRVRQIAQWYRYQTLIQRDVTSERVAQTFIGKPDVIDFNDAS